MTPLRILLLSDGRPGHFRQSEAIVAALRRRRAVDLDRIDLNAWAAVPKALLPRLARWLPPGPFLRYVHGLDAAAISRPDLIVSAGAGTIGANAALARLLGSPNVFCGSTRGLNHQSFRLILLPYRSAAGQPNVAILPKPSCLDPALLPPPRPLCRETDLDGARVTVLIGGPVVNAAFATEDWHDLVRLAEAVAERWRMRVVLVTSRRTPQEAYNAILPAVQRGTLRLVDYRAEGLGSIDAALDTDLILVTADSMSMMTEAALSQRPAVALMPRRVRPHRDDEAVRTLRQDGVLGVVDLAQATPDVIAAAALTLRPMTGNHLDRLARTVASATGLEIDTVPDQQPEQEPRSCP